MRFGVYAGPSFPGNRALPAEQALRYAVRISTKARDSGLDGVFVGHHYLVGPDIQIFQPLIMLAHIAAHCPSMYLGTCIFLLSLHNPVEVAEEAAAVDVMTGGRLLFGVGQGYLDAEFSSFGIEKASRARRLEEAVRGLRTLWREDRASLDGEFFRFANVQLSVKPLRPNGPPILVAADTVKSAARVPARGGDFWLVSPRHSRVFLRQAVPAYKASLERAGRPFKGLPMARDLWIAGTKREAESMIRESFEGYYRQYTRWGQPGERYDLSFDELKGGRVILGNPEEVAEQILEYHKEFGAEFMWFRVYWPGMPLEQTLDVIERLARDVLPVVKSATGPSQVW